MGELQSMRLLKMAIVKAAPVNRYRDEVGPLCNYVIDSQSLEGSLQGMFCHLRSECALTGGAKNRLRGMCCAMLCCVCANQSESDLVVV